MDYQALKAEILNDPMGLGYGPFVESGGDGGIEELINRTTGPGAGQVEVGTVTKNAFLLRIVTPAVMALGGKSPEIQAKWNALKDIALGAESFDCQDPAVKAILASAVSDGVLTQEAVDAFTHRGGSRAEVILGPGEKPTHIDIAIALRGQE